MDTKNDRLRKSQGAGMTEREHRQARRLLAYKIQVHRLKHRIQELESKLRDVLEFVEKHMEPPQVISQWGGVLRGDWKAPTRYCSICGSELKIAIYFNPSDDCADLAYVCPVFGCRLVYTNDGRIEWPFWTDSVAPIEADIVGLVLL